MKLKTTLILKLKFGDFMEEKKNNRLYNLLFIFYKLILKYKSQ